MTKKNNQKTKPKSDAVVTHIIEQSIWRVRQDIDTWRGAIMAAENIIYPQRVHLYTLYDEIILDAHVQAVMGQRINKLLSQDFRLVDEGGKDVQQAKEIFESQWFHEFMKLALESVFWGHSLIQLWDAIPDKGYGLVELVPRRHVIPEFG